jgi:hypothetical protein
LKNMRIRNSIGKSFVFKRNDFPIEFYFSE